MGDEMEKSQRFNYVEKTLQKPPPPETRSEIIPGFRVTPSYKDRFNKAQLVESNRRGVCLTTSEYLSRAVYFAMAYMPYEHLIRSMQFHDGEKVTIKLHK